jgi:hypothetical protein
MNCDTKHKYKYCICGMRIRNDRQEQHLTSKKHKEHMNTEKKSPTIVSYNYYLRFD